jgi:hypothetical protein
MRINHSSVAAALPRGWEPLDQSSDLYCHFDDFSRTRAIERKLVEMQGRRRRLHHVLDAGRSVQVEVPGVFGAEHEQLVEAYVTGETSADDAYERTVVRHRES